MTSPPDRTDSFLLAGEIDPALLRPEAFWSPEFLAYSYWLEHAPFAFWLMGAHRPRTLVELGAYGGFSYFAFLQAAERMGLPTQAFAVDTWEGDPHNGAYDETVYRRVLARNARYGDRSRLIRATFADARHHFADGSIDLLHIDGYHTYEAVRGDFETYRDKLSPRAVVLFHDTNVRLRDFGVWRFWEEIQGLWPSFEFLHGNGLGVLGIGPEQTDAMRRLFAAGADPNARIALRAAYARLGAAVTMEAGENAPGFAQPTAPPAAPAPDIMPLVRELKQLRAALSSPPPPIQAVPQRPPPRAGRVRLPSRPPRRPQPVRPRLERLAALIARLPGVRARLDHIANDPVLEPHPRDFLRYGRALLRRIGGLLTPGAHLLFDPDWYVRQDSQANETNAAARYASVGWKWGLSPHPLFDPAWYRAQRADLAAAEIDPLGHYLAFGWREGLSPHPLFDPAWYVAQVDDAEAREGPALAHYVAKGASLRLSPHPLFDPRHYLAQVEAVVADAAAHYVVYGADAGLSPHPLVDVSRLPDRSLTAYVAGGWRDGQSPHSLFDPDWYRARAKRTVEGEPLGDYLRTGVSEGLSPHPLFDAPYYRAQAIDLPPNDDPLKHYVTMGDTRSSYPNALFDPDWYRAQIGGDANSSMSLLEHYLAHGSAACLPPHPWFDPAFYRHRCPDATGEPLAHYFTSGREEGATPHPFFDPEWYRNRYKDVRGDPLAHFLAVGASDGRAPHPLFDPDWYREQAKLPNVSTTELVVHYRTQGWRMGLSPHPFFDPGWYRETYSVSGDPLLDWVEAGGARDPHPLVTAEVSAVVSGAQAPNALFDLDWYARTYRVPAERAALDYRLAPIAVRNPNPLFDARFYLAHSPDVRASGLDPFAHYLRYGWREGRATHPLFDPKEYWHRYPDVAGSDALEHYLRFGVREGRDPHPLFDAAFYQRQISPVSELATLPEGGRTPFADRSTRGETIYAFTSIALNYAPKAIALALSLRRHLPQVRRVVIVAEPMGAEARAALGAAFDEVIAIDQLGIENWRGWVFGHTLVEACTAVKGPALSRLLERSDCKAVLYFDPDTVAFGPIESVFAALENYEVVLTPHLTRPEVDPTAVIDNEIAALRHGAYNLGFVAVRASEGGRRFADWWRSRLLEHCRADIASGLFTDQRWVDLAPSLFDRVLILRDPTLNVAPWNLTHRKVEGNFDKGFTVEGRPLGFFHFSGFDSGAQGRIVEKYAADQNAVHLLREWYREEITRNDLANLSRTPWRLSVFDDGVPITDEQRRAYRFDATAKSLFPNPFSIGADGGFRAWAEARGIARAFKTSREAAGLSHYLAEGESLGLLPNPWFDPTFYRASNSDVPPEQSALVHYASRGALEGRDPSSLFELGVYRRQLSPAEAAEEPLTHFFREGRIRGLRVSGAFNPRFDHAAAEALRRALRTTVPLIAILTHDRGGGTERHISALIASIAKDADVVLLRADGLGRLHVTLAEPRTYGRLRFDGPRQIDDLASFLHDCGVRRLHVHHVLGCDAFAETLVGLIGVPFDFTQHDYFVVSPQPFLAGPDGRFVGEDVDAVADQLLAASFSPGVKSLSQWRRRQEWLLRDSDRWFVPSADMQRRMARLFGGRSAQVVSQPGNFDGAWARPSPKPISPDAPLHVALLGGIGAHKGARVLIEAARFASAADAPLRFTVIGTIDDREGEAAAAGVSVVGAYRDDETSALINRVDPDLVWFPAQAPEAYGFTLSEARCAGRPVLVPDLGPYADRLAGQEWAFMAPWALTAEQWGEIMLRLRAEHFVVGKAPARFAASGALHPVQFDAADYLAPLAATPLRMARKTS